MGRIIAVIICCFFLTIVQSEKVIKITADTTPLKQADVLIQRCTEEYNTTKGLYYFQRQNTLLFVDEYSATVYEWKIDTGKLNYKQISEIKGQDLAFKIPFKNDVNKYILGIDKDFRYVTRNKDDSYKLSDVIATLPKKDRIYYLDYANCDSDGKLFAVANAQIFGVQFSAKLYKLNGTNVTEMAFIPEKSHGFTFDSKYKNIYILGYTGSVIYKMKYTMNGGKIDNDRQVVFNITQTKYKCYTMTAITMDRNDSIWVAASSKKGLVLKIDPASKKVKRTIVLPTTDITSMTFGRENYQTLFVSSQAINMEGEGQGAIYAITGMDVKGIPDKPYLG